MNFFAFWILTIILSYGFSIDLFYRMIKDFASRGYILDVNNIKNMATVTNKNSVNENNFKIPYLIPVLNLLSIFSYGQQYVENKTMIFNNLKGFLYLSPMTDKEYQRYKENPSVGSIFTIMREREIIEQQRKMIIEKLETLKNEEDNILQEESNVKENIFGYKGINSLESESNLEEKPKVKTLSIKK